MATRQTYLCVRALSMSHHLFVVDFHTLTSIARDSNEILNVISSDFFPSWKSYPSNLISQGLFGCSRPPKLGVFKTIFLLLQNRFMYFSFLMHFQRNYAFVILLHVSLVFCVTVVKLKLLCLMLFILLFLVV